MGSPGSSPEGSGRRAVLATLAGLGGAAPAVAQPRRGTIAFLGDVMIGRDVSAELRRRPPEWFWGEVLPVLRSADATIANLESPVTQAPRRQRRTLKWHHFRAAPEALAILAAGGIRAVSIANNHILDYGEEGLAETRRLLAEAGIVAVGAGRDAAEAARPALLDLPSVRIGMLAGTDALEPYAAGDGRAGNNQMHFRAGSPALPDLAATATELRRRGAGLLVLSLHWGPNFRRVPFDHTRAFARGALAAGFDLIHGHSAHILHGVEARGSGLVLYDTGNVLDDYWPVPPFHQERGCVFLLDLENGRPRRLRLVPFVARPWPLRLATGRERRAILAGMQRASATLGTVLRESEEGLVLDLPAPGG